MLVFKWWQLSETNTPFLHILTSPEKNIYFFCLLPELEPLTKCVGKRRKALGKTDPQICFWCQRPVDEIAVNYKKRNRRKKETIRKDRKRSSKTNAWYCLPLLKCNTSLQGKLSNGISSGVVRSVERFFGVDNDRWNEDIF